jgi:hypothetical protein
MPHWEERDRYMTVVGSWLRAHDGDAGRDQADGPAELREL